MQDVRELEIKVKKTFLPFLTAILKVAFGDPRMWWRFCNTFAYANGTTSIGTPCTNYVTMSTEKYKSVSGFPFYIVESIGTYIGAQVLHIFPVVGHENEAGKRSTE